MVRLRTKPELAVQLMQRLFQELFLIWWMVANTVYDDNLDLRNWLEAHGYPYVVVVASNEPVGMQAPDGRHIRVEVQEVKVLLLSDHQWQRRSMSEGTKGPRLFAGPSFPSHTTGER